MSEEQSVSVAFDNTYARLPERFFAKVKPATVAGPKLIKLNLALATELGLELTSLTDPSGVEMLAGNRVAEGSEPIALAYAGHQFGHFVPQLGDGRATLIGEVVARNGQRFDIQLKGSGPTPFSRRGDGRAALGPVLREYIMSEAMAALGVPTTRALAAVATGESVVRERILPGAVFTRVAASHLRVGTFQYFAAREDTEALKILAEHAITRHYPEAGKSPRRYQAFLSGVVGRQARLVAQWMLLGFVHGVMNTDNTSVSGETIDYGPCAFLEAYDPEQVFSSIDQQGRYAYNNQARAMHWNLVRLAECLIPLLVEEEGSEEAAILSATQVLDTFLPDFNAAREEGLRRKLGLFTKQDGDSALAEELLNLMAKNDADFTATFRSLCDAIERDSGVRAVGNLLAKSEGYQGWMTRWRQRLAADPIAVQERRAAMQQVNPVFIPRNHLVQEVIEAAYNGDYEPFEELVEVVTRPYDDHLVWQRYSLAAKPEERVLETYCGT